MNFIKILIASASVLIINSSYACESVDLKLSEYNHGFASAIDLAKTIECNLDKEMTSKQLCGTRIGLKKDKYSFAKKQYEYGFITKEELTSLKNEYQELLKSCNK